MTKFIWKSREFGNACHIIEQCCIALKKKPTSLNAPKAHLTTIFLVFACPPQKNDSSSSCSDCFLDGIWSVWEHTWRVEKIEVSAWTASLLEQHR